MVKKKFRKTLYFILFAAIFSGFSPGTATAETNLVLPEAAAEEVFASPAAIAPIAPEAGAEEGGFFGMIREGFSLHRENYLLPFTWSDSASRARDAELKFQFSFKQQLWRGLTFGYTQKSFWRVLDQENSRPFRETNYNPELFYRLQYATPSGLGWGTDLGIEHESNGNREPDSRSWNRLYFAPFINFGPLHAELKLWQRLSEPAKKTPDDPAGDENPDILDYYGYGELRLAYITASQHRASLLTRWNFATEKGALELDYSIPTGTKNLFIYAQFWTGYGESLIDYNHSVTRYGIGVLIR